MKIDGVYSSTIYILGTQYSEWFPVPEDKSTYVNELVEGKKFQVQTDKKIDGSNDIKWSMGGFPPDESWFTLRTGFLASKYCNNGYTLQGTEGFLQRAGVLTFLKTTTQLQIWFDDVLEVTWVYEDKDENDKCAMRNKLAGLRFNGAHPDRIDKVSIHYRYELGNLSQLCATITND